MNDEAKVGSRGPVAKIRRHGRFSPVWLIPIVAAGLVAYLGYNSFSDHGPELTLYLTSADGLTVEQTQVKHKAVTLGTVSEISLSPDMKSVVVKARMIGRARSILTDHARFWVVRPRITAGSLTGLETLVSGTYIEVDPGPPGGKKQREFVALKEPPGRQSDEPGHVFVLRAKRLGSLKAGAPVYYRDVEVGEVLSGEFGEGLDSVSIRMFVREPYDRFVHPQTRFWNASGISVTMGPDGMRVVVESIQSLLGGGLAFETPRANENDPPAEEGANFDLYEDKATAEAAFYRVNIPYVSYFQTSVQGLCKGSPVQLFGVQVGSVSDVKLVYDWNTGGMVARVAFDVQPERVLNKNGPRDLPVPDEWRTAFAHGSLRVQLGSSSLLTGAKDLALVYTDGKGPPTLPKEGDAFVLPGEGGGIESLTASLSDVATKMNKIPFEQIGHNANGALVSIQHLAQQIDTNAAPALAQLPMIAAQVSQAAQNASGALGPAGYGEHSQFERNMERMMNQMNDAARSFRYLSDYLDRHPEALIRGRASQEDGR